MVLLQLENNKKKDEVKCKGNQILFFPGLSPNTPLKRQTFIPVKKVFLPKMWRWLLCSQPSWEWIMKIKLTSTGTFSHLLQHVESDLIQEDLDSSSGSEGTCRLYGFLFFLSSFIAHICSKIMLFEVCMFHGSGALKKLFQINGTRWSV